MVIMDNIKKTNNTELSFSRLLTVNSTYSSEQSVNADVELEVTSFNKLSGEFSAITGVTGYYPSTFSGLITAWKEDGNSSYIFLSDTNVKKIFDLDISEFVKIKFSASCKSDNYRGYVSFNNIILS